MSGGLVITGFGAFSSAADNPSQRLVEYLARSPDLLVADTRLELLDVEYAKVGTWLDGLLRDPPRALLLTGFSAGATGLTLESRATCEFAPDHPDNIGHVPPPDSGGPWDNEHLDLPAIQRALRVAGLPAAISCDAGRYLCNFSYRKALFAIAEERLPLRALFVHLPALEESELAETSAAAMTLAEMARGIAIIGEAMLGET